MKKFFPFMLAVLSCLLVDGHIAPVLPAGTAHNPLSSHTAIVGEPVAADDVSENNPPGSIVSVLFLFNDMLSVGPVSPSLVNIDLDAVMPGNQFTSFVPGQGTWTYDGIFILAFTPLVGFNGNPTPITYTLTEKSTGLSDQATVTVKYLGKPIATNDISSNNTPGSIATIPILSNDILTNGSAPAPGDVTVDIDPATPGSQSNRIVLGQGQWTYQPVTGSLTFTPLPGFTGDPTPISYTLTDSANDVSDPATVTVDYANAPTGPVATDDISKNNIPGSIVSIAILNNDLLSTGVGLFAVTVDVDASMPGNQSTLTVPAQGTWMFDGILFLTFSPVAGLIGDPTPIIYTITENGTILSDQATVTVYYVNEVTAISDLSGNHLPGAPATILILNNDFLADASTPAPGDVTVDINPATPGIQTTLVVPGQGTWTYTPTTGTLIFNPGPALAGNPTPISYTLTDITNDVSDPATVTVAYVPPTVAADDVSNINAPGNAVLVQILANDQSALGSVFPSVVVVDIDASMIGNQSILTVPGQGTWVYDAITGILTFTPVPGLVGDPTPITYTLTDNFTSLSDQATVTVQYLAPPVANSRKITISTPSVGSTLLLDGQSGHPAPLSGIDPQDGSLGTGGTFVITNVNGLNGNTLLYNNVSITTGPLTIANYNPSLLTAKFTGVGSNSVSFRYLVKDSQGLSSPEVTYELNWGGPLPVTLISFNAKAEASEVVLYWATSEESNSDHFEIQRSGDGVNWQSLDRVAAAGLSSTVRRYSFTDHYPVTGQNLFRLKMVDMDNSYTYSVTRSVRITGREKITMSPNPVSDMLTVNLPSWKNVSTLTICDQSGRKRWSTQPAAKAEIDVRQFQAGIYLVVIHYKNGVTHSQQIMIK